MGIISIIVFVLVFYIAIIDNQLFTNGTVIHCIPNITTLYQLDIFIFGSIITTIPKAGINEIICLLLIFVLV